MTGSPWVSDDFDNEAEVGGESMPPFAASGAEPDGPEEQATGTPLPFLDSEVAAELAEEPLPPWFGVRWREIEPEHQSAAWNGLRRWVDWFVAEYCFETAVVPPCWYLHSNITAELYAAMCMEHKVWDEQVPGVGPMMLWHAHVDMLTGRLRRMTEAAACVNSGRHKEPEAFAGRAAFELDYDEDAWAQHAGTSREAETIQRPEQGVRYVRAAVMDAEGSVVATSNPVGMKAVQAGEVTASLSVASAAVDEMELKVAVTGDKQDVFVQWEESTDAVNWKILGDDEDATDEEAAHSTSE